MARPVETIIVIKNGDLCSTLPEKNEGCETGCVCGVDSECIGLCPYYDCGAYDAPCFVDTLTKMCKRDPQVLAATPGLGFREQDLLEQNRLYLNNNKKMLYAGAAKNPTAWRKLMTEWRLLTPKGDKCDDTYRIVRLVANVSMLVRLAINDVRVGRRHMKCYMVVMRQFLNGMTMWRGKMMHLDPHLQCLLVE
eukprot:628481_1